MQDLFGLTGRKKEVMVKLNQGSSFLPFSLFGNLVLQVRTNKNKDLIFSFPDNLVAACQIAPLQPDHPDTPLGDRSTQTATDLSEEVVEADPRVVEVRVRGPARDVNPCSTMTWAWSWRTRCRWWGKARRLHRAVLPRETFCRP